MSVIEEFFRHEFDEHVRRVLLTEIRARRAAYLTFNVFNIRLDPDAGLATVEDELDPAREESVDFDTFARMVAQKPTT